MGANPFSSLVQGSNGNLYGVTYYGGNSTICGTIFRITLQGTFATMHEFANADGCNPYGSLILATDGNLYGTTYFGGSHDAGTVFRITPAGRLTTLYSFCSQTFCLDGVQPEGSLLQATDGKFYGITVAGGTQTVGTVFSLSTGLRSFVETIPTSGKIGSRVVILGNGLSGTTSVTFNGTPAAFAVVSDTEITASVPTGATTGALQVDTPGGALNSDVAFRVMR